jgi:hypothetical protein
MNISLQMSTSISEDLAVAIHSKSRQSHRIFLQYALVAPYVETLRKAQSAVECGQQCKSLYFLRL